MFYDRQSGLRELNKYFFQFDRKYSYFYGFEQKEMELFTKKKREVDAIVENLYHRGVQKTNFPNANIAKKHEHATFLHSFFIPNRSRQFDSVTFDCIVA